MESSQLQPHAHPGRGLVGSNGCSNLGRTERLTTGGGGSWLPFGIAARYTRIHDETVLSEDVDYTV